MAGEADRDPRLGELGEFIRLQRRLADLSLRQLADLTQVSNAYLSQIERGLHQPSLRVLRSIADALDVSADAMLTQAGLLDATRAAGADDGTGPGTEAAILADPDLDDDARRTLLTVYRSLRRPT